MYILSFIVPSPEVKLFGVSSGSTRVLGSSVSLTCTIQHQRGRYVDTPTTVISSWDAPNNIYSGDNEDNVTSVDLNIASLGTADSGVYRCLANMVDSSGNEYIADSSTATASESIVISKMKCHILHVC